jgi:hypothetical protein
MMLPAAGGVLSISEGRYLIESNNIIIPNINNLTIQGSSSTGNAIFAAFACLNRITKFQISPLSSNIVE